MKKLCIVATVSTLLMITSVSNAQNTKTECQTTYEQKTIFLNGSSGNYEKNGENKKIGVFGKQLKKEFDDASIEAKNEIELFQKKNKRAAILSGVVACAIVSAAVVAPLVSIPVYAGIISLGIISEGFAIAYGIKSTKHLHKAIWLRNRDVLAKN